MTNLTDMYLTAGLAVVMYVTAWFVLAVTYKRRDVADIAWGPGFVLAAWVAYSLRNNDSAAAAAALVLVGIWGSRLFLHIGNRNVRKKEEDERYQALGGSGGAGFWARTYWSVFLFQGGLTLLVATPVFAIMHADRAPFGPLVIGGLLVWAAGIAFEAVADWQPQRFLGRGKKGVMDSGLWRYSRHPNYFGELVTWWGAYLVALAFGQWWAVIGPLTITFLIVRVSGIPPLEKKYADNPAFQDYAQRTSVLIPMPPKAPSSRNIIILYIPGLGDDNLTLRQRLLGLWRYRGISVELSPVGWKTDESWQAKLDRLVNRVTYYANKGHRVVLIGESAGAAAAPQVLEARPNMISGVVLLCGKTQYPELLGNHYKSQNPSLLDAVTASSQAIARLTDAQKAKIINVHGIYDEVVSVQETRIPGVQDVTLPVAGHPITITFAITAWSFRIARFARRMALKQG